MKKCALCLSTFLAVSLFVSAGCRNQSEPGLELSDRIRVHFHQPAEMMIVEALQFEIAGEIESDARENRTFFYQIDDGHGNLAEGELSLQENGQFQQTVSITNPTNPYGVISVYVDSNGDGVFDVETDQLLSTHTVSFAEKIQVPLTPLNEKERSADGQEDHALGPDLLDSIKTAAYEHASSLRDNWRMDRESFERENWPVHVVEEDCIVTWASDGVGPSVLIVFKKDRHQWQVVFSEWIGRDVIAFRIYDTMDQGWLAAVESYYPAGTGEQRTHADLYLIRGERVKKVWDIQNAGVTTVVLDDGVEEETRLALAYSILPTHLQPDAGIVLSVYGEQTVTRKKGTELVSKEVIPIHRAYVWDESEQRFRLAD